MPLPVTVVPPLLTELLAELLLDGRNDYSATRRRAAACKVRPVRAIRLRVPYKHRGDELHEASAGGAQGGNVVEPRSQRQCTAPTHRTASSSASLCSSRRLSQSASASIVAQLATAARDTMGRKARERARPSTKPDRHSLLCRKEGEAESTSYASLHDSPWLEAALVPPHVKSSIRKCFVECSSVHRVAV